MEEVILVDKQDNPIGKMEKLQAHVEGLLHRAFSIFIFNENGDLLLQQRALSKYHSGGLWTNSCCSHPRVNETLSFATERRLQEELGFTTQVIEIDSILYKAAFGNGLTEHEFDYIFIGEYNGLVDFNPEEVEQVKFISRKDLDQWLIDQPSDFTAWFPLCWEKVKNELDKNSRAIA
ncbi:isopentenyl-diphosphate Delta-isomerase [Flammeovirga pectinis]|uniref:Isopentenyl-diphosphate delta-isomerase n=1 Tax=Flammeovirga pectinis TaxID=2494373 RepID=A0A3S9P082_9BACT|nr:isopentenyl-diphosphate Delta-isomerase [Flammeovirga pectinis]AZQ61598.1 isopentenyl-diphosphate Delta-isomerase [Flammeovirga pectinis]